MRFLKPGLCATALVLAGCGGVPLGTALELKDVDPLTTDASMLRFAFDIPDGLRPRAVEAELSLVDANGDVLVNDVIPLEQVPSLPAHGALPAYRLAKADVARVDAFRTRALAEKADGGSGSVGVVLRLCHLGEERPKRAPVGIWVRTIETVRYVPLQRQLDVIGMLPEDQRADAVPRCEGAAG